MEGAALIGLAQLVANAKQGGVDLDVIEQPEFIYVLWMERTTGKKGAGARVIRDLLRYADRKRKRVCLWSETPLIAYYQALGFQITEAWNSGVGMARMPQSHGLPPEPLP